MASLAEKLMREMMMRLGAEDSDSRRARGPPPRAQDLSGQQPSTTEMAKPTFSTEHATEQQAQRQATEQVKQQRLDLQRPVHMQTEQSSPALQQNRRRAEARAHGERKTKKARGMSPKPSVVLEQNMVPEPSVLLEPEDVPIPDADDLVI